jgi:uncharacterized membrane protein
MSKTDPKKTSLGLNENVEGLLCYVLTWITGIIFLILQKENRFVRFHAIQSIVTFLPLMILAIIIGLIPFIGWIISPLLWILSFILWIVLMFKAYSGQMFKLPIAGDIAEKQLNKSM